MSGYNLPDGVSQAMIDRAYQGDNCGILSHGELNLDGTCDNCRDAAHGSETDHVTDSDWEMGR